jgi:NAD(P)-dependent dehydrogenase (short-subunit alcohol dehydrogenase family)
MTDSRGIHSFMRSHAKARREYMLLANKNVVIYGAGGVIGGAVARAFASEGAKVFLAGRTSEHAGAMTGTVANLTCGVILD